eukprot:TRINITY_DN9407_c0_g1_i2.p1 TRINITY_DN9407_c0_g1~~TRINITY_DN9407_c0_g1_i2.p1  ORF type:complete len:494 (+),score=75.02 TRINITY_DN9407_c0_g1_i2:99-1484(+)
MADGPKRQNSALTHNETDFMVLQYTCHDGTTLGSHSKDTKWKVQVFGDKVVEMHVHVNKPLVGATQAGIFCNGEQIFPHDNKKAGPILEDLTYEHGFIGAVKSLNHKDFFEIRKPAGGKESWYTSTLTEQHDDQSFEATVIMPGTSGSVKTVHMCGVHSEDIRERQSKEKLVIPERQLLLTVPQAAPLMASLAVDIDKMPVLQFFARPCPPPGTIRQALQLRVDKKYTRIDGHVGRDAFMRYIKPEAFIVGMKAESKTKHTWQIQIGPDAVHDFALEKSHGNQLALTVDGSLLVDSNQEDLGCKEHEWKVDFQLRGSRELAFTVHDMTATGHPLDSTCIVMRKSHFAVQCSIRTWNLKDLVEAQLFVNGVQSKDLPEPPKEFKESPLSLSIEDFQSSSSIRVPHSVKWDAKSTDEVNSGSNSGSKGFLDFFTCCQNPAISHGPTTEEAIVNLGRAQEVRQN